MGEFKRTVFFQENKIQGAKFVEFAGYEMPVMYTGIIDEHLATRKRAGLFDISHRGRFLVRGRDALRFLQHSSTNNVQALDKPETGAQYTLIPNETGGAVARCLSLPIRARSHQIEAAFLKDELLF